MKFQVIIWLMVMTVLILGAYLITEPFVLTKLVVDKSTAQTYILVPIVPIDQRFPNFF